jgi:N-glycosidase YbiA
MTQITSFSGKHRWLSNFYVCSVHFEGHYYPSVENAYQAAKVHPSQRAPFRDCQPSHAKRLGRAAELPADWDSRRLAVMRQCLEDKFSVVGLRCALVATGDAVLIEDNNWGDTFWGVCKGRGENRLGKMLMEIRARYAR